MEYLIKEESLKALADLVRNKTGATDEMSLTEILEQIQPLAVVSGVTAEPADVRAEKHFVGADGVLVEGTMPQGNKYGYHPLYVGADSDSIEIEPGYHKGGEITVISESKTVTPSKNTQYIYGNRYKYYGQNITLREGTKFINQVIVNPIPDKYQDVSEVTAVASKVVAGSKFVDAEGNIVEGTLEVETEPAEANVTINNNRSSGIVYVDYLDGDTLKTANVDAGGTLAFNLKIGSTFVLRHNTVKQRGTATLPNGSTSITWTENPKFNVNVNGGKSKSANQIPYNTGTNQYMAKIYNILVSDAEVTVTVT